MILALVAFFFLVPLHHGHPKSYDVFLSGVSLFLMLIFWMQRVASDAKIT